MKGLGTAIFICYTQNYYLHVEGHCVAVLHSGVYFEKNVGCIGKGSSTTLLTLFCNFWIEIRSLLLQHCGIIVLVASIC